MQIWVVSVIGAGIGVLLVVIVLAVFFCHRQEGVNGVKWSFGISDTEILLRSESVLDRFILFGINLLSLAWNTEHNIVHSNRAVVYFRRFINISAVLLFLFTIDLMDIIWANWCCYPNPNPTTVTLGTCSNPAAAIRNASFYQECTRPTGWLWAANVAFVLTIVASVLLQLYLWKHFVHDVKHELEGQYTGLIDMVNNTTALPKEEAKYIKWYIWMTMHQHRKKNVKTNEFNFPSVNLQRCSHLFMDVFAILSGIPHIILSRTDLAILQMINVVFMIGTLVAYQDASNTWANTCGYYDSETSSGRFGVCTNATSIIARDPNRLSCAGTYSSEMKFLIWFFVIELVGMLLMWLYTYTVFHHLLHDQNKSMINNLHKIIKDEKRKIQISAYIALHPHPVYGHEKTLR